MDVRFSPEAETQIAVRRGWWREHRDAVDIFDEELAHAIARIGDSTFPWFGIRNAPNLVRRKLRATAGSGAPRARASPDADASTTAVRGSSGPARVVVESQVIAPAGVAAPGVARALRNRGGFRTRCSTAASTCLHKPSPARRKSGQSHEAARGANDESRESYGRARSSSARPSR
jgi:hypothetical protein